MKRPGHKFLHRTAALVLGVAWTIAFIATPAAAQSDRTIKIVVPFPPGGAIDVLARMLADQIGKAHGPAVVIEDRPGAGTVIGTEAVFRAKPDGNTLLIDNNSFVIAPHLHKVP
jgi:tripartite-type tricarboxylate transporter receptor subunit TctC